MAAGWPSVARAATCGHSAGTLQIGLPASGETATIGRTIGGFTLNGNPCLSPNTITVVAVTGAAADQHVRLQLPLTGFGGPHIVYHVDLQTGSNDTLQVDGTSATDHMVMGTSGINFDVAVDASRDVTSIVGADAVFVNGASGADTLSGAGGSDTGATTSQPLKILDGPGTDTVTGGSGGDVFVRGAGNDTYDGRTGSDTIDNSLATSPVTEDLAAFGGGVNTGGLGSDTTASVENVAGSSFGDTFLGTPSANTLLGLGGNDRLIGRGGADNLHGGGGADTFVEGAGVDKLFGEAGLDTVDYSAETAAVHVTLPFGPVVAPSGNDQINSVEGVLGSGFADTLIGGVEADVFHGLAGNDFIQGNGGDDQLFGETGTADVADYSTAPVPVAVNLSFGQAAGGADDDTLSTIENVVGSAFDDVLAGNMSVNRLDGGAGDDRIEGEGANDALLGGPGDKDVVQYGLSPSAVTADLGNGTSGGGDGADQLSGFERISGSPHDDTLEGDDQDNEIRGGGGNDTLRGHGGADAFLREPGTDTYDGGPGTDLLNFKGGGTPVSVDLQAGTASSDFGGLDSVVAVENVLGGGGDDSLSGDTGPNVFDGGGGDDTFNGRGGNDVLDGGDEDFFDTVVYPNAPGPVSVDLTHGTASGDGSDTLTDIEAADGSPSGDTLTGRATGASRLHGLGGNDTLTGGGSVDTLAGGPGDDTLDGAGGEDFADYGAAAAAVSVRLDLGTATGEGSDTLSAIEDIAGSPFADLIVGSIGPNTILGDAGNDVLLGAPGADVINGGEGSDAILGGAGSDSLDGGEDAGGDDDDFVDYALSPAGVTVDLGSPTVADGTGGTDTITRFEGVVGSGFADTLTGNGGPNTLNGGAGSDTLSGLAGNDTLNGGDGNDTLDGGNDTDTCTQGAGTGSRTSCELGT